MRWVVDTSVVAKWFVRIGEKNLEQALALRQRAVTHPGSILAPDFLWIELANVLVKGRKLGGDKTALALTAVTQIGVVRLETPDRVLALATAIADVYGTSVYDALLLAHARENQCGWVTADEKVVKRLHGEPGIHLLGDWRSNG